MSTSTYYTIYGITTDAAMLSRVAASAKQQASLADPPILMPDPEAWSMLHRWEWAVAPGWSTKVESALASGNEEWGQDGSVITDGDILAVIQPMVLAEQPEPEPE